MGAVGYLKGELPPGTEGGGGGAEAVGRLQRAAEDKTAVRARWEMVRKLLLATEAHRKREAQKARRQRVKATLLHAQAEELVCSRLLRATLTELEESPTVYVPGYDGAPSSTAVDVEWNLGTEALGESFKRTRRGKPQATGGNASAAHVCYYCAAPEIRGKDPYEPPSRGHHRYFECTKRKRDNRREFHSLSRAPDALIDELLTEKRDAARMQHDIIALHQVSVAAAQLSRRQSYWLGGACRMVAIRLLILTLTLTLPLTLTRSPSASAATSSATHRARCRRRHLPWS